MNFEYTLLTVKEAKREGICPDCMLEHAFADFVELPHAKNEPLLLKTWCKHCGSYAVAIEEENVPAALVSELHTNGPFRVSTDTDFFDTE